MTLILQKQGSRSSSKRKKLYLQSCCHCQESQRQQKASWKAGRQAGSLAEAAVVHKQGELISRISKTNTRACTILQNKHNFADFVVLLFFRSLSLSFFTLSLGCPHENSISILRNCCCCKGMCTNFHKTAKKFGADALRHILVGSTQLSTHTNKRVSAAWP